MSFILDYINIRDAMISFLNSVNTTTAQFDLSSNLPVRVAEDSVEARDIFHFSEWSTSYPLVKVQMSNKTNEEILTNYASNSSRQADFSLQIDCVYQSYDQDNDKYLGYLVRNVESNIRNNINLSGYNTNGASILYMIPETINFQSFERDTGFNRSASIFVNIRAYIGV